MSCMLSKNPTFGEVFYGSFSAVNQNKIQRNLCSKGHRDYKYCKHYNNGRLNTVIKQGLVHREAYTI